MTTVTRIVADTHAVIWYFARFFNQQNLNSDGVNDVFHQVLNKPLTNLRLVIPSVVFLEIFDKFCRTENDAARIYYECFVPLETCPNVEIRELDKEVIEMVINLEGELKGHEVNDKIVVATSAVLNCVLLTKDPVIQKFSSNTNLIHVRW
jgi:PIN domain nuclease of toxin-antitoxin system